MRVRVEIADTPYKLSTGLMFRQALSSDAGMLFVFPRAQRLSFWGENTFIPLDIAFIDHQKCIAAVGRIDKLSKKAVASDVPCVMAIEVNAGFLARHGIKVGDSVDILEDKFEGTVVSFKKKAGSDSKISEASTNGKSVNAARRRIEDIPGQMMLPFGDSSSRSVTGNKPSAPVANQSPTAVPDETSSPLSQSEQPVGDEGLPEVNVGEVSFADEDGINEDDPQVDFDGQGNPIWPTQTPEAPEPSQEQGTEGLPEGEEEQPELPPDASTMSTSEAIQKAIDENLVMWLYYITKPKKKKIGGWGGNQTVLRIVEPHGLFLSKTTHNNILVVWDETVDDIRAYIVDRIQDKAFTGQHFEKRFVVIH